MTHNSHLHSEGLVFCCFLGCEFRVSELPLVGVSCFCWYPHVGLDPFAHTVAPPSLWLDSRSLAQFLVVDLCIFFHQLLDGGSSLCFDPVKYPVYFVLLYSQIFSPYPFRHDY